MRLLLDTQIAVWWQLGSPRLTSGARALIESNQDQVMVSYVSIWELVLKSGAKVGIEPAAFAQEVTRLGFEWLPIEIAHLLRLPSLPQFADHKDPFDRLLVAQAKEERIELVTTDRRLARYGDLIRVV